MSYVSAGILLGGGGGGGGYGGGHGHGHGGGEEVQGNIQQFNQAGYIIMDKRYINF